MATAVIMPKAGMSMETGTIVRWLKKVGEDVTVGEPLLEITTDKVDMEVEAEASGCLLQILHGEGDVVPVTEAIGYIGTRAELARRDPVLNGPSSESSSAAAPVPAPAPVAPTATMPGRVRSTPAAKERAAALGVDIALAKATGPSGEVKLRDVLSVAAGPKLRASPLARQMAKDAGIDLARVQGSGPGGRILRADVAATPPPASALPSAPDANEERIPVSKKRKVIAERLSQSKLAAPHYYLRLAASAEGLIAARNAGTGGAKPSVNAFLMKYAAEALRRYPAMNSSWQADTIVRYRSIDIGLAVAQPDGLITPVVRDCGSKGVLAIDAELKPLVERAQAGTLGPDDYSQATFTISNLGSFGIDEFTAIINPPGSAILAVGSFRKQPVVDSDGALVVKTLVQLTLSCDHRVIDGAVGARFLRFMGDIMENPSVLLL